MKWCYSLIVFSFFYSCEETHSVYYIHENFNGLVAIIHSNNVNSKSNNNKRIYYIKGENNLIINNKYSVEKGNLINNFIVVNDANFL